MVKRYVKVSIGLPVYNGARFLRGALESLVSQSFEDFELIISDNASSDNSEEICREVADRDQRVRYYRNRHNVGAAANFNLTFQLASGQLFKWAAHDDLCGSEFLERCVEVLDEDRGAVLAYPKAAIIDADGRIVERYARELSTNSPSLPVRFNALLEGHRCFEIFGLIRREALQRTPLMGGYAHGDGVLLSRLAFLGRFRAIPEYLFFARRHGEQSMSMLGDYREYAIWFDPRLSNKITFPYWRIHFENWRSIRAGSMTLWDRMRCYRGLARKTYARRRRLYGELVSGAREWGRRIVSSPEKQVS